ncbi:Ig-like domain-containing protein [Paenibacillus luteus]|uniref:Ig-like domain-containing protein n=1 Tax=Paenibacillus luteus TaxID=2545753 RepID=UPI0019D507BB|nr:Ig-like domain-containing protein [Paenibacillus luteus]
MNNRKSLAFKRTFLLWMVMLLMLQVWAPSQASAADPGTDWRDIGPSGTSAFRATSVFASALDNGVLYAASFTKISSPTEDELSIQSYDGQKWKSITSQKLLSRNGAIDKIAMKVHNGIIYVAFTNYPSGTFPNYFTLVKCVPGSPNYTCTSYSPSGGAANYMNFDLNVSDDGTPYVGVVSYPAQSSWVIKFTNDSFSVVDLNLGRNVPPQNGVNYATNYVAVASGSGKTYAAMVDSRTFGGVGVVVQNEGSTMANSIGVAPNTVKQIALSVYGGQPYLAYYDDGNSSSYDDNKIVLKRYEGSNWKTLGEYTMPSGGYIAGAINGKYLDVFADSSGAYVAFTDKGGISVLKSTGTSLEPVGSLVNPGRAFTNFVSVYRDSVSGLLYTGYYDSSGYIKKFGVDTVAPLATQFTPATGTVDVSVDTGLEVTFNEIVLPGSGKINLKRVGDDELLGSIVASDASQVTVSYKKAFIKPSTKLKYGTEYYVEIEPGAFKDLDGNLYAGTNDSPEIKEWSFKTVADVTPPSLITLSPTDKAVNVLLDSKLSLTFNEPIVATDAFIDLYKLNGDLVESIKASNKTRVAVSGNRATITPADGLLNDTSYYVIVPKGAFQDESGNDYAGLNAPTDWNFRTIPDLIPPTIVSLSPAHQAVGVARDTKLTLKFSEPVLPVAGKKLTLYYKDVSNQSLTQVINLSDASKVNISSETVTVTINELFYGDNVYVSIESGALTDLAGNPFAGIQYGDWQFKTVQDTIAPYVTQYTPENGGTNVPVTIKELQFVFNEEVKFTNDGRYKYLRIFSKDGQEIQKIDMASNGSLNKNVMNVRLGNKALEYDTDYYVKIDADSFDDMARITVNPNGYGYLGNSYKGISDNTTWAFRTGPDRDPPILVGLAPQNGAKSVLVKTMLAIELNKPIKVGTGNVRIYKQGTDELVDTIPVNGKKVEVENFTMILTPTASLESLTGYYVKVDAGAIKDLNGNSYAGFSDKTTWAFTTAPDTMPPVHETLSPPDDAKNVALDTDLAITFDENVNAVTGKTIKLYKSGNSTPIATIPVEDTTVSGRMVTVRLKAKLPSGLAYGTDYYVNVESGAFKDLAGNPYGGINGNSAWNFTTEFLLSDVESTVEASPTQVIADGVSASTITVTLRDDQKRTIAGRMVTLSASGDSSVIAPAQALTDASGKAIFKVKDSEVEKVVYSAKAGTKTIKQTAVVNFVAGPINGAFSIVKAAPASVPADGKTASVIAVTLKDAYGHGIPGQTVSLTAGAGSSAIDAVQPVTDLYGKAVFLVKDQVVEQVVYTARTGGLILAQQATVNFEASLPGGEGPKASVLQSRVSASPTVVKANGADVSTITVTLRDSNGASVPGKKVSLTADGGISDIAVVRDISDDEGRALFIVKNAKAEQVTYTAKVVTDNVTIADKASVTFESPRSSDPAAPAVSVLKSSLEASPVVVTANGKSFAILTATLRDEDGKPISGKKVVLAQGEGSSIVTALHDTTDADGEAVFKVTNTKAEPVTYSASLAAGSATLAQRAKVTFESENVGGPGGTIVSVLRSSITSNPAVVTANGTSSAGIIVILRDENGIPVSGKKVALTQNGSSHIVFGSDISDSLGIVRFTVTSETADQVAYTAHLTESGATLSQQAIVTFESATVKAGGSKTSVLDSTVVASPAVVAANGTDVSTITVTMKDVFGLPVPGKTVSLTANVGSSVVEAEGGVVITDAFGQVKFKVTNQKAEQIFYTAKDETDGVTPAQRATVTFETAASGGPGGPGGVSVLESTVIASPDTVAADGASFSTVTVTLNDKGGQLITGKEVTLNADGGNSVIEAVGGGISNAQGRATFKVKNTHAEQIEYTAVIQADGVTIAQRATVTFETFGSGAGGPIVSVLDSTVIASPEQVTADGNDFSVITVTLKDTTGAAVSGKRVTLVANGGSSEIVPVGTGVSDVNGQVKFRVTDVHGEQVTYTAKLTADNVTLAQWATVTFETAGSDSGSSDVSVVHSTVVASPVTVAANGKSFSIVTVTLNNADGYPVISKKVTLSADGGNSIIQPIGTGVSDDAGQATFKVTDAVAERVTYTAQVLDDGVTLAQRASVVFEAGLPGEETPRASVLKSTVTAVPDNVKADGIDFSTITVVIKDADGNPLSGKSVSLSADSPRVVLTTLAGVTNERGEATFKARNYYAEKVLFIAKVAADQVTIAQRAAVTFEYASSGSPDEKAISVSKSTVVANPDVVLADGTTKSTITVTLVDASGAPIADKTVKLTAGNGSSVITALGGGKSGSDGKVTFEVTNKKAEQVIYSAQVVGDGVTLAQRATVTFESLATVNGPGGESTPGISVQNSRVEANPVIVTANGSSFSTIKVTLKDVNGTAAVGKTVKLSADGGSSVIAAVNAVTNGQGQAVFTVKNKAAEQVAYTASIEAEGVTLAQRATVTFESSAGEATADAVVNVLDSTVKASPEQVTADGLDASTITVTLRNASGQPIAGKTVTLMVNVGSSSVIAPADGVVSGADGVARFTVTDSKAEQATYTAHVTEDGVTLAQRATVMFESDASGGGAGTPVISIVKSTVTASPTVVAANGKAQAKITVTLKDANGNPIGGKSVTLAANAGNSSIIAPVGDAISGADGVAQFIVTDAKAEQVTYTAKVEDATLAQRAKVTFETPQSFPVTSVTQSTVTASPATVAADGTAFSTITAVLKDVADKPLAGKTVSVTASSASSIVTAMNAKTDVNGIAMFKATNTKAESVAYTAAVEEDQVTLAQRATVTFESTGTGSTGIADVSVLRSIVTATPNVVDADGVQTSTVKVQLLNASGEPIKGLNVSLTASGGSSVIDAVYGTAGVEVSNDNGEAFFLVKDSKAERVTYSAHVDPGVTIAQMAIVTFETPASGGGPGTPGISVMQSTVMATPAKVTADGVQSSLITVTLKDTEGNAVAGKTIELTADSGSSVIVAIQAITDVNGNATFSVTNTKAEQVTYTAAVVLDNVTIAQTATVIFETNNGGHSGGSNVSVLKSAVTAAPQTVAANGASASTITIALKDANGLPVAGQTVTLTADGGSSTITPVNAITNALGIAVFKVTSLEAGQVTYRAETADAVIAQTATVTFQTVSTAGSPTTSVARSTVTASPDRINADGKATATVTVTLLNAVGQPVVGKKVKLTAANGHSIITSAGEVVSDEQGQAVFKVTNVYAEQVTYSAKDTTDNVSIAQTATVTFLANAGTGSAKSSVTRSTVTVSPDRVTADSEAYATVTVTLLNTNGQPVVGKTVTLNANGGRSTIAKVGSNVSDAQGKVVFRVSDAYAEQVTYSAKDTTDNVSIAQTATVTFLANTVTGEQKTSVARSTVTASPAEIIGNGIETSTVTVTLRNANGQPVVGKKVILIASDGSSIIAPAGEVVSDAQGQATFTVKNNVVEQVTYSARDTTDNVNIAQTATVKFKPKEPSRKLKPEDIEPEADKKKVTVKDVPPGGKVVIYDDNGGVIGEGENPGPDAGPIVINIIEPHVIKEGEVIHVTLTEPGKKEGDPVDKTVRKDIDTSLPVPPPKVLADLDNNEVKILDVLPGATIKIYDKDGNVIGTGTNPGPGTGTIVIKVNAPYVIKEGDVIQLTATESGLKESGKTSKTVTRDDLVSKNLKPEQIVPESDKKTVTVTDVPPGGKVKVYDKDGNVIGEGTNPGPGSGPVVISVPNLKEGDSIRATLTEPGKRESEKTEKTATKDKDTSLPPKGAFVRQASDEVEVPVVPPGTTVNVYDDEGNLIGTASNPSSEPAKVVVQLKPKKRLLPGDIVRVTQTEPGKKESGKVPATVPSSKLYDLEAEVQGKTIKVKVKPKPGSNPAVETAYLIIQGIRGDTPVYVKSYKIDLKNIPATFPFELDKAIAGDKLYIVISSKPANVRSDVGYSLSDETTATV